MADQRFSEAHGDAEREAAKQQAERARMMKLREAVWERRGPAKRAEREARQRAGKEHKKANRKNAASFVDSSSKIVSAKHPNAPLRKPNFRVYGFAFVFTFLVCLGASGFRNIPAVLFGSSFVFAVFAVGRLAFHNQYGWFRDYSEIAMKVTWAVFAIFGGFVLFGSYGILAFIVTPITAIPVVYGLSFAWGLHEDK